jgi:hypothetical protein
MRATHLATLDCCENAATQHIFCMASCQSKLTEQQGLCVPAAAARHTARASVCKFAATLNLKMFYIRAKAAEPLSMQICRSSIAQYIKALALDASDRWLVAAEHNSFASLQWTDSEPCPRCKRRCRLIGHWNSWMVRSSWSRPLGHTSRARKPHSPCWLPQTSVQCHSPRVGHELSLRLLCQAGEDELVQVSGTHVCPYPVLKPSLACLSSAVDCAA